MKTVVRRIARLEDHFKPARNPRQRLRIVVRTTDRKPSSNATCRRTVWPDGTLFEMVRLDRIGEGGKDFTAEEFETWIETFPIETR